MKVSTATLLILLPLSSSYLIEKKDVAIRIKDRRFLQKGEIRKSKHISTTKTSFAMIMFL